MSNTVDDCSSMKTQLNNICSVVCSCGGKCKAQHTITVGDIDKGINGLHNNKRDGTCDMLSDHLINGTPNLNVHLSLLFTAMLRHGFSPSQFCMSKLIPIPKNKKKSINDSSNYRAIAMSNILGKLLDKVILANHTMALKSSDLQFGFKSESSTTACTFVLDEVVNYYNRNGSDVHVVLLDASKAFDRVDHIKLFHILVGTGVCPTLLKLLFNMYSKQIITVQWGNVTSNAFKTSNGVMQGGVLSPISFTLYIDLLLSRLRSCGFGCYIGQSFVGALGYADDIVLLAPTRYSLSRLLKECELFSEEYLLTFNANKSNYIVFPHAGDNVSTNITFMNNQIASSDSSIHLGNVIGPNISAKRGEASIADFNRKINVFLSSFHNVSTNCLYKIFISICMSLYGCQLWDVSHRYTNNFFVSWRKAIRRMFKLPYRTHSCLLHFIINDLPVDGQIHLRIIKFFNCMYKNNVMSLCGRLAANGSGLPASNSLNFVCYMYKIGKSDLPHLLPQCVKQVVCSHYRAKDTLANIQKAIFINNILIDMYSHSFFNSTPFKDILNFVCCDNI